MERRKLGEGGSGGDGCGKVLMWRGSTYCACAINVDGNPPRVASFAGLLPCLFWSVYKSAKLNVI